MSRILLLFGLTLLAIGCGADSKPPTTSVSGKVMFKKNTPASGALVVFHPVDPEVEKRLGGKPFGRVAEDGRYTLTTYGDAPNGGAPAGEYGVTIQWNKTPKAGALSIGDGGASGQSLLNPKYGNPAQPFTKVTVKKGEPNEFNFDVD